MSTENLQIAENATLTEKTRLLLKNRPAWMSYTRIEKDTGLKASWVNKFACSSHDSNATKVIKLYEYLTNTKLNIA